MNDDPVKAPRRKTQGRFHHGDLAEQAVVEAMRIVAERGHNALSMRAIAQALGVTEPALYRHYEGRQDLLAEVSMRGFERFGAAMIAEVEHAADALDGVRRFCRAYVRFASENRGWFRLTFSLEMSEMTYAPARMAGRLADVEQARIDLLVQLAGLLPAGDDRTADLYRLIWGTAHGLAFLVVERVFQLVQTDEERIAAADTAIELLVESIAARSAHGP